MNVKTQRCIFNLFLIFALITAGLVSATERITSFHADITVHQDGSMTVDETIKVVAEGDTIKHGIVREFPTQYKDRLGNTHAVGFSVIRVERDRYREPYFIEHASNGERVFIGSSDTYVARGEHTYRIRYNTDFQLGFFKEHDELYWNVTGNGWRFPIDIATALVHLPAEISSQQIHAEAYTGMWGSRGSTFTYMVNPDNTIAFEARNLNRYEGLTVVVTWPKGFVVEPTFVQKAVRFLKSNGVVAAMLMGLICLLIYYSIILAVVRRRDKAGVIIPLYEPPYRLTPGAMRYVDRMKHDANVLVAELINLAVLGLITIKSEKKQYSLIKTEKSELSDQDTYGLMPLLFAFGGDELIVSKNNQGIFSNADQAIQASCRRQYESSYFDYNRKYHVFGLVILFLILVFFYNYNLGWIAVFIFGGLMGLFGYLLRRYTPEGRKVKDAIDGFKMFLSATETERLRILSSPEEALVEYEYYLPYAFALGVEENWTKQFAPAFNLLAQQGKAYVPIWYVGKKFDAHHMGDFTRTLGSSFANAIAAATTVPGSKSGSGGRGSSGGGGGGGGGGGW